MKYGFMVCEFDGSIEDLETQDNNKPPHEYQGFFYAKWFNSIEERDRTKAYTLKAIEEYRLKRSRA